MNMLSKKSYALSAAVLFGLLGANSIVNAEEFGFKLGVTTVDQVGVKAAAEMSINGAVLASLGSKCKIPQRVEILTAFDNTATTFTAQSVAQTGSDVCGGTATPAFFVLNGVKGQQVQITLDSVPDAAAVAKFKPEGVFSNIGTITTGTTDFDYVAPPFTAVATLQDWEAILNQNFVEIYSTKQVALNASGFAVLRVGGELEITSDQLMPDTKYQVQYNVNIVYK
ncbi:hypothetical protein [Pseudoalteromonas tunicata]|uniref:hypothetical protein n=1 Tax=Pseudoalteromonas tunicata TaxID=314281 RepID=UPI00273D942A|nr:hypothetical protein [Pseudoalteromonas tunicata]MDP4985340.1 hypothetical protein [Pseudoalteromonas tunicata]